MLTEIIVILMALGIILNVHVAASLVLAKLREMQREQRQANVAIMDYLEQGRNGPLLLHDPQKKWSLTVLGREVIREEKSAE